MDRDALRAAPLGRLVGLAGHLASRRWSQYLADQHGLTPAGMGVVLALGRDGDLTHRDLASRCFVRPATLTGVVDTLQKAGVVERLRDEGDRRTVRLALTEAGRHHHDRIVAVMRGDRPLTSVDADPVKAAVIRAFLVEMIETMSAEQDTGGDDDDRGGRGA